RSAESRSGTDASQLPSGSLLPERSRRRDRGGGRGLDWMRGTAGDRRKRGHDRRFGRPWSIRDGALRPERHQEVPFVHPSDLLQGGHQRIPLSVVRGGRGGERLRVLQLVVRFLQVVTGG